MKKKIIGIDFGTNEYTICRSFEENGTITLKSVEKVSKPKTITEKAKQDESKNKIQKDVL